MLGDPTRTIAKHLYRTNSAARSAAIAMLRPRSGFAPGMAGYCPVSGAPPRSRQRVLEALRRLDNSEGRMSFSGRDASSRVLQTGSGWDAVYGRASAHHGRGVFGQRVAPHTNGTASPPSIKIAPTSRPLDFNVPQSLP
jgi:hypothetical protein